jgi:Tfp pilus assembly protein PilN
LEVALLVRGGSDSIGGAAYGTGDWDWRRVPKISIVSPGKAGRKGLVVMGIALLLIVEVVLIVVLYFDRSGTKGEIETQRRVLASAQSQASALQSDIGALNERIAGLEAQMAPATQPEQQPAQAVVKWEPALTALTDLENADVRLEAISTSPDGMIKLNGTATGIAAIGQFQADLEANSDIIELLSLQWKGEETGVLFDATLQVK